MKNFKYKTSKDGIRKLKKKVKKLGKIIFFYRNTVQKESEPFDVPSKNVKSRTTAKVSVLHRTNHQANVNILKANLGTLFLFLNFIKAHNRK